MQTFVSRLTTTFVDDAIELVKGFGKIRPRPWKRSLSPFASLHYLT
jgi:hypothetical protein